MFKKLMMAAVLVVAVAAPAQATLTVKYALRGLDPAAGEQTNALIRLYLQGELSGVTTICGAPENFQVKEMFEELVVMMRDVTQRDAAIADIPTASFVQSYLDYQHGIKCPQAGGAEAN